jgi:hypothetical protein
MNMIFYILGAGIAILLIGAIVVVVMASGSKSQSRRMQDLHTRHVARQPWDAESADGRGNR